MAKAFYQIKRLLAYFTAAQAMLFGWSAFAVEVDLLAYMRDQIQPPSIIAVESASIPPYNRRRHFGGWKFQDAENPCQTTRATVLKREADPAVRLTYTNRYGCTVATGLWHDPYTGHDVTEARQIQIDHMVPLKVAYYAGAYAWSSAVRCNYANYIGNEAQLWAVDAHENMSKGDRGPAEYLPPNTAEHCRYVNAWMRTKAIWRLRTTENEVKAIYAVFQHEDCGRSMRYMEADELRVQRAQAETPIAGCVGRPE